MGHMTRDKATTASAPILEMVSASSAENNPDFSERLFASPILRPRLGICSRGSALASDCYLWVGWAPLPMFADTANVVCREGVALRTLPPKSNIRVVQPFVGICDGLLNGRDGRTLKAPLRF